MMKILVSAYSCNPYLGSEPGVGWAAVCRIARHHEVTVLTGARGRKDHERAATEGLIPGNVTFEYLDEKPEYHQNRFIARIQSWLRYRSFTKRVLAEAARLVEKEDFDLCHQVTIAAWRMPSALWKLPIPFVWGPIGGAGEIPGTFRGMLAPSARFFEWMRDVNTRIASRSRDFLECMENASHVFAANAETLEFLTPFRKGREISRLPIASISVEKAKDFARPEVTRDSPEVLRLFAGGNMEGRKGGTLALRALALFKEKGGKFHYIVAGGGPDIEPLKALAQSLGIADSVEFHAGFSGDEYRKTLWKTDVYFLPSFRESTPVTLLEACLAGCYPLVADTSAQGEIVGLTGGAAVPTDSLEGLVEGMAEALWWCYQNREETSRVGREASVRVAKEFAADLYDQAIAEVYGCACQ
jgi:glycosyltransferase involved in cell wall biosynthesis